MVGKMKQPQTLSMKFSPLAPVPAEELKERQKKAEEERLSKLDPNHLHWEESIADKEQDAAKAVVTLRREDFLKKEFYLPNHRPGIADEYVDVTPIQKKALQADYFNEIKKKKVITQSDHPVTGLLATFSGHSAAITCCKVAMIEGEEFAFTGSMDCTVRVFSLVTGNCVRTFEGHTDHVTSLQVCNVVGSERHSETSRTIKNTLNPRWGNADFDFFEFQLLNIEKVIIIKLYDWDAVGEHDVIGGVELLLDDDVLQGRRTEDPRVVEWYNLTLDGKEGRGQVQIEFRWENRTNMLGVLLIQAKALPAMDGTFGKADPYVTILVQDQTLMRLFSGSADSTAKCWDLYTGKVVQAFRGHKRGITQVNTAWAFSKERFFTSSMDRTVKMWNIETGECMKSIEHSKGVTSFVLNSISFGQTRQVTEEMIKVPADIRVRIKYDFHPLTKTKTLTVTIEQARNLPAMDSGSGSSDPFVVVSIGDEKHKTTVKSKNLNPTWNEQFEFAEFRMDEELVISIYDWDAVNAIGGSGDYIGHIAVLMDQMHQKRVLHEWFPIDHNPYSQVNLYTGGSDGTIRVFDLRLGVELREYLGHKGGVTSLEIAESQAKLRLFSSSLDCTIKMWDLKKSSRQVNAAIRSWVFPHSINGMMTTSILKARRIFGACSDGIIYMNSLPADIVKQDDSWRSKILKFIESIPVSIFVLACCILDAFTALYFEFGLPEDKKDCFARDGLESIIIVFFVLGVFTIELALHMIATGKSYFVPVTVWNYMDMVVVGISLAVAFYKSWYDASTEVYDKNGNWLPPIVSTVSHPELCGVSSGTGTSQQATQTQKSLTSIRIARMVARIALAVRVLRAVVKAAKITARLGDLLKGKEYEGHRGWVSAIVCIEPTQEAMSTFKKIREKIFGKSEKISIKDYRLKLRRSVRMVTASGDGTIMMWDPTTDNANYRRNRPHFTPDEIAKSGFNLTMVKKEFKSHVKNRRRQTKDEKAAEKVMKQGGRDDADGVHIISLAV